MTGLKCRVHMEECTPIRNVLSEHPKLNSSVTSTQIRNQEHGQPRGHPCLILLAPLGLSVWEATLSPTPTPTPAPGTHCGICMVLAALVAHSSGCDIPRGQATLHLHALW